MAANGVIFTDAHSCSSVSTPTRYGIITGRYNWRSKLKSGVLYGYSRPIIPAISFKFNSRHDTGSIPL